MSKFNPTLIQELLMERFFETPVLFSYVEVLGTTIHGITSGLSAVAVTTLLVYLTVVALFMKHKSGDRVFLSTQLGLYFVCLLLSDLFQSIGGLLQFYWAGQRGMTEGGLCTLQSVLLQIGNLGAAVWSVIIAMHSFNSLVLRKRLPKWAFISVVIGLWIFIVFLTIIGPAAVQRTDHGPFYGLAGHWCWITPGYATARILVHYLPMFIAAILSSILSFAVFLSLRGNLIAEGFHIRITWRTCKLNLWNGQVNTDEEYRNFLMTVGNSMLWNPLCYLLLILPISIVQFTSMSGHNVSVGAWFFAGCWVSLMGLAHVVVYGVTRRVLGPRPFRTDDEMHSQDTRTTAFKRSREGRGKADGTESFTNQDLSPSKAQENAWKAVRPPVEWAPPKTPESSGRQQMYSAIETRPISYLPPSIVAAPLLPTPIVADSHGSDTTPRQPFMPTHRRSESSSHSRSSRPSISDARPAGLSTDIGRSLTGSSEALDRAIVPAAYLQKSWDHRRQESGTSTNTASSRALSAFSADDLTSLLPPPRPKNTHAPAVFRSADALPTQDITEAHPQISPGGATDSILQMYTSPSGRGKAAVSAVGRPPSRASSKRGRHSRGPSVQSKTSVSSQGGQWPPLPSTRERSQSRSKPGPGFI